MEEQTEHPSSLSGMDREWNKTTDTRSPTIRALLPKNIIVSHRGHHLNVGYHFNEFSVLANVIRDYDNSRNVSLGADISIGLQWHSISHLKSKCKSTRDKS